MFVMNSDTGKSFWVKFPEWSRAEEASTASVALKSNDAYPSKAEDRFYVRLLQRVWRLAGLKV